MKKQLTLVWVTLGLLVILGFMGNIINFIINIKWFTEVGYLSVYFTRLVAILEMMVPIFIIAYLGIWFYYRSLRKSIIRWRKAVEVKTKSRKLERIVFIIADIFVSFIMSFSIASGYWYNILQFKNSTNFGIKDPIFNMDISFFVFKLPLIQSLYDAVMSLLIFLVVITVVAYFVLNTKDKIMRGNLDDIRGSLSDIFSMKSGITKFAGKQLATVSACILLTTSLGFLLKSWDLVYSPRGVAFGASYTDIHVTKFFYIVIAVASLLAAIVIFISVLASKIKPIIFSIAVIFILMIGESLTSVVVQNFVVKSNEKTLEAPYIKNNIDFTRRAFNIDKIQELPFTVNNDLTSADLTANKDLIDNIRINSFVPALEFYNQIQTLKQYYTFNDADVDRYTINGKYTQVFVSAREIDTAAIDPNTWQNKHLIYTHGYGAVVSKVNSVTSEGQPDFVIKDLPPNKITDIPFTNPRIYFGESTNDYAIVDTAIDEVDYPQGVKDVKNNYSGTAGIKMTFMNKILFALGEKDLNFLLSRDINSNSKILINRNIMDRVTKIAPLLSYDKDPYAVISNGKLNWIIDAYTTSANYPYSQPQNGINYIRNSVKVVVDAENGNISFYIVDKTDPIVETYAKIFPDLFKDAADAPKDIVAHFRYPEDLFTVQSSVYSKYHMTDPGQFYNGEDLWDVSTNQKQVNGVAIPENPYVIMNIDKTMPNEMALLGYFNYRNKNIMSSLLAARMDKDNYGKLVTYRFPAQTSIYGPLQFKQRINQDTTISQELSLWNKEGSQVIYGDTIILPIKNSLLYIEPLYLRASGKSSIPEMKRVIVSYGDKLIMAVSINDALKQIFNFTNDNGTVTQGQTSKPAPSPNSLTSVTSTEIRQIKDVFDKAIEAQKAGDWAKYGEYIKQMGTLINNSVK